MTPVANNMNNANRCQAERPRKRDCGTSKTNVSKPIDTPLGNVALSLSSFDNRAVG